MDSIQRKTYTPPALVAHGSVESQTRGGPSIPPYEPSMTLHQSGE